MLFPWSFFRCSCSSRSRIILLGLHPSWAAYYHDHDHDHHDNDHDHDHDIHDDDDNIHIDNNGPCTFL